MLGQQGQGKLKSQNKARSKPERFHWYPVHDLWKELSGIILVLHSQSLPNFTMYIYENSGTNLKKENLNTVFARCSQANAEPNPKYQGSAKMATVISSTPWEDTKGLLRRRKVACNRPSWLCGSPWTGTESRSYISLLRSFLPLSPHSLPCLSPAPPPPPALEHILPTSPQTCSPLCPLAVWVTPERQITGLPIALGYLWCLLALSPENMPYVHLWQCVPAVSWCTELSSGF